MNKQTEAMKRALVDEDGENRAVRWFLAAYRNPGMSVGGMKAHLKLSGYPLWPDWVERCHPSEHLTKAGAQLWIRHLFSLEATPPAAPVQDDIPKIGCVNHDCDKCKAAAPVQELEKAAAMALDAIAESGDFLFNWHDCEPNNEREMDGYSEVLALNEKAFNALRKCLLTPAAQKPFVGLTDEEANELWESTDSDWELMKRTEAKLRERNGG